MPDRQEFIEEQLADAASVRSFIERSTARYGSQADQKPALIAALDIALEAMEQNGDVPPGITLGSDQRRMAIAANIAESGYWGWAQIGTPRDEIPNFNRVLAEANRAAPEQFTSLAAGSTSAVNAEEYAERAADAAMSGKRLDPTLGENLFTEAAKDLDSPRAVEEFLQGREARIAELRAAGEEVYADVYERRAMEVIEEKRAAGIGPQRDFDAVFERKAREAEEARLEAERVRGEEAALAQGQVDVDNAYNAAVTKAKGVVAGMSPEEVQRGIAELGVLADKNPGADLMNVADVPAELKALLLVGNDLERRGVEPDAQKILAAAQSPGATITPDLTVPDMAANVKTLGGQDAYDVIGVSRGSTAGQIDAVYAAAMDDSTLSVADRARLEAAYSIVSDPSSREAYNAMQLDASRVAAPEVGNVSVIEGTPPSREQLEAIRDAMAENQPRRAPPVPAIPIDQLGPGDLAQVPDGPNFNRRGSQPSVPAQAASEVATMSTISEDAARNRPPAEPLAPLPQDANGFYIRADGRPTRDPFDYDGARARVGMDPIDLQQDTLVPGVNAPRDAFDLGSVAKDARNAKIATTAVGAAGVGVGAFALANSIQQGDGVGATIAGVDVAAGSAQLAMQAGLIDDVAGIAAKGLAKANVLATAADGIYQVFQEDGVENKAIRGGGVALSAGASAGTGALLTGGLTTTGGVLATGGGAALLTAAAPVVAAGAIGYTVNELVSGAIESNKIYEQAFNVEADMTNRQNLMAFAAGGYYATKDSPFLADAVRNDRGSVDLTVPENLPKLRAAIMAFSDGQEKIMEKNEPTLPMWAGVLPFTDLEGRAKFADAKVQVGFANAALSELDSLEKEMRQKSREAAPEQLIDAQRLTRTEPEKTRETPMVPEVPKSLSGMSAEALAAAVGAAKGAVSKDFGMAQADQNTNKAANVRNDKGGGERTV